MDQHVCRSGRADLVDHFHPDVAFSVLPMPSLVTLLGLRGAGMRTKGFCMRHPKTDRVSGTTAKTVCNKKPRPLALPICPMPVILARCDRSISVVSCTRSTTASASAHVRVCCECGLHKSFKGYIGNALANDTRLSHLSRSAFVVAEKPKHHMPSDLLSLPRVSSDAYL